MKPILTSTFSAVALGCLVPAGVAFLAIQGCLRNLDSSGEIAIQEARSLSHDLPSVISKAYSATSISPIHGDRSSALIVKFPKEQSEEFLTELKNRQANYEWRDSAARHSNFGWMKDLIDEEFLPSRQDSEIVIGNQRRPKPGQFVKEITQYIVAPGDGLFYILEHTF